MPSRGHCSRACTNASCARSSARPTSPTRRATTAVTLAASMRQTASSVRATSSVRGPVVGDTPPLSHATSPATHLVTVNVLRLQPAGADRFRVCCGEVLGREDLPQLEGQAGFGRARRRPLPEPLDGLLAGADVDDREAGDELPGLGEGPVGDDPVTVLPRDARTLGTGVQALPVDEDPGLEHLLVVGVHVGELLPGAGPALLGLGAGRDEDHEAHGRLLGGSLGVRAGPGPRLTSTSNGTAGSRHAPRVYRRNSELEADRRGRLDAVTEG